MIKVPLEMPVDCLECPFFVKAHLLLVDREDGLYKRIARCQFAPAEIDDPWRNIYKVDGHKEEWCPLEEVEE